MHANAVVPIKFVSDGLAPFPRLEAGLGADLLDYLFRLSDLPYKLDHVCLSDKQPYVYLGPLSYDTRGQHFLYDALYSFPSSLRDFGDGCAFSAWLFCFMCNDFLPTCIHGMHLFGCAR